MDRRAFPESLHYAGWLGRGHKTGARGIPRRTRCVDTPQSLRLTALANARSLNSSLRWRLVATPSTSSHSAWSASIASPHAACDARGRHRLAGNLSVERLSDLSLGDLLQRSSGRRVLRNIPKRASADSSHASRSGLPRTTERLTTRARSVPYIPHRPPTRHSQSTCFVWRQQ